VRRIRSCLRDVLPPAWAVATFLFMYGLIEGAMLWIQFQFRELLVDYPAEYDVPDFPRIEGPRDALLLAACAAYGAFRVVRMHPLFSREHYQWLAASAWRPAIPLPLGPVALRPSDGLVVAVLFAMAHGTIVHPAWFPVAFLIGYLSFVALTFFWLGLKWHVYAVAFGLGCVPALWDQPLAALAALAVVYRVAYAGLRRTWEMFPWDVQAIIDRGWTVLSEKSARSLALERSLGWPHDQLRPPKPSVFTRVDGVLCGLLLGWFSYGGSCLPFNDESDGLIFSTLITAIAVVLAAFARFIIVVIEHRPGLGLRARLTTGRLIVPKYDKIVVAPALSLLIAVGGPPWMMWIAAPTAIAVTVPPALALMVMLAMGPDLNTWKLTAPTRIVPVKSNSELEEI